MRAKAYSPGQSPSTKLRGCLTVGLPVKGSGCCCPTTGMTKRQARRITTKCRAFDIGVILRVYTLTNVVVRCAKMIDVEENFAAFHTNTVKRGRRFSLLDAVSGRNGCVRVSR